MSKDTAFTQQSVVVIDIKIIFSFGVVLVYKRDFIFVFRNVGLHVNIWVFP